MMHLNVTNWINSQNRTEINNTTSYCSTFELSQPLCVIYKIVESNYINSRLPPPLTKWHVLTLVFGVLQVSAYYKLEDVW
jgi:hypothetical protein